MLLPDVAVHFDYLTLLWDEVGRTIRLFVIVLRHSEYMTDGNRILGVLQTLRFDL